MMWHAGAGLGRKHQHLPFPLPKWRPSLCLSCKAVRTFFWWEGTITQICCYRIFSVSLRTQPDAAAKLVIVGSVCPALEWPIFVECERKNEATLSLETDGN